MLRRKSRKRLFEMPLHKKRKTLSIHLSKEVKEKHRIKKRSIPVKKGDKVKVMRGKYKGKEGKVIGVSYTKGVVFIEGIAIQNSRQKEKPVPFQPSNLIITELKIDRDREKLLQIKNVKEV